MPPSIESHRPEHTLNTMATRTAQPGTCNIPNRTVFEGDNLDVMRGMNDACVDLIYLDPPFNSNRDYAAPIGSKAAGAAFKDTWGLTDVDEAWHNEIAETDLALYKVIDASEHSHGSGMKSYLIMMAVRLLEMKRILKPTAIDSIYQRVAIQKIINKRNKTTTRNTKSTNGLFARGSISCADSGSGSWGGSGSIARADSCLHGLT